VKLSHHLLSVLSACDQAALAVAARDENPVLTCLHLNAGDGKADLVVTGTDRLAWVRVTVPGIEINNPGECVVPAAELRRWLKASPPGKLSLEVSDSQLSLRAGGGRAYLPTHDPAKYPHPRRETPVVTTCTVTAGAFLDALARASVAVERKENSTYTTAGVLVEASGSGLTLVSTDTRRMAVVRLPCTTGEDAAAILPARVTHLLPPLLAAEGDVEVVLCQGEAVFRTPRIQVGTRLLHGRYPPWRKFQELCPTEGPGVQLPAKALRAAVAQAAAVGTRRRMTVSLAADALTLTCPGASSTVLDLPGNATEAANDFDHEYLSDFLDVAIRQDCETVSLWPYADKKRAWVLRAGEEWSYFLVSLIDGPYNGGDNAGNGPEPATGG
jgi:DNA polymerase III sliding clamp (beta) subunit (PCNA family)